MLFVCWERLDFYNLDVLFFCTFLIYIKCLTFY